MQFAEVFAHANVGWGHDPTDPLTMIVLLGFIAIHNIMHRLQHRKHCNLVGGVITQPYDWLARSTEIYRFNRKLPFAGNTPPGCALIWVRVLGA